VGQLEGEWNDRASGFLVRGSEKAFREGTATFAAAGHVSADTLSEVAEQVGYGSEAALSRAYKRWVGVAPAEWRRLRRSSRS
jgi:AraC-like DNA-binding protein